jgi:hypothetical protein
MRVLLIVLAALAAALIAAVLIWRVSGGRVLFFPLVLLFGLPLVPLLGRRKSG